ncbi:DUF2786 domain-containing protein [Gordonia bronchialis]|uniref:DUF2786 domain-containing protein n=1 Tax=Gordonia bronchialis TaxID=2054 RepID=UPI001CBDB302|nr:DUF2786 domain-containing protein [Gordonia bronchialis]UAK38425.1 DUF2786 domain-containing protein [Gordonia bronchialis]
MTENKDDQKILNRVRALLEKARNVAGTPEADAFNAKAFELIAKYGIDAEVAARKRIDRNIDDSKLIAATFTFTNFATQRIELLWAIAGSLHCAGIVITQDGKRAVKIFGVARHIRRVKLLHPLLSAQMLAGASKVLPADIRQAGAINEQRANWMKGFADGVELKIREIEQAAIRQADMNAGDTSMAVARKSDMQRAWDALAKQYPMRGRGFRGTQRGAGYSEGRAAGSQVDVGQTRVGAGAQRALT